MNYKNIRKSDEQPINQIVAKILSYKTYVTGNSIFNVLKNIFALSISTLAEKGKLYFLLILIARNWPRELFGDFSFALALASLFIFSCDWGMDILLIREIARNPHESDVLLSHAFVISIISTAFTLFILLLGTLIWKGNILFLKILAFCFTYIALGVSVNLLRSFFYAKEKMEIETAGRIIECIISLPLGILVIYKSFSPILLMAILICARLFNFGYLYWTYCKINGHFSFNFDYSTGKKLFSASLPFGINVFFSLLYAQSSIVILGFLREASDVAIFKSALNLLLPLTLMTEALTMAFFPKFVLYYNYKRKKLYEITKKLTYYFSPFMISMSFLLFYFARYLLNIAYRQNFPEAVLVLQIISFTLFFKGMKTIYAFILTSINKQKDRTKAVGIGSCSSICIYYFLIRKYSYIGAAFAYLFTEIIIFTLIIFYLQETLLVIFPIRFLLKIRPPYNDLQNN